LQVEVSKGPLCEPELVALNLGQGGSPLSACLLCLDAKPCQDIHFGDISRFLGTLMFVILMEASVDLLPTSCRVK